MKERIFRTIQQTALELDILPIPNNEAIIIADAVLYALQEPTEPMIASVESYCIGCCNMTDQHVTEVFGDMIKTAREGK